MSSGMKREINDAIALLENDLFLIESSLYLLEHSLRERGERELFDLINKILNQSNQFVEHNMSIVGLLRREGKQLG